MNKKNNSLIPTYEMQCILDGIQDIVKIFYTDHTIYFCNKAGYKFYNKGNGEIEGQSCYKLLNRTTRCSDCRFNEVIEKKQVLKQERYIPELNKIMDICYSPILDNEGEVKFVVEKLHDITEKRMLDNILKNDRERYKEILECSPDAILIIYDNKIVLANNEASNLFKLEIRQLIDSNIYMYFNGKDSKTIHRKFRKIMLAKKSKFLYDCELKLHSENNISVQISCSNIHYEGNPSILMTIRNTSEMKRELIRASQFQRNNLQKNFPGEKYMKIVTEYVPSYIVSGDFYKIVQVNDKLFLGVLVDVKGKGISAALNISAFELMFIEEIFKNNKPVEIVKNLNKRLSNYYEENYIAVSCFSLDFFKNEFCISGAGLNQFIIHKNGEEAKIVSVEGLFLGMFEDSEFYDVKISIGSGDRIFLVSDGLDFIFDEDRVIQKYMEKVSIEEFKDYIGKYLEDVILENDRLIDDCTMIAIEII